MVLQETKRLLWPRQSHGWLDAHCRHAHLRHLFKDVFSTPKRTTVSTCTHSRCPACNHTAIRLRHDIMQGRKFLCDDRLVKPLKSIRVDEEESNDEVKDWKYAGAIKGWEAESRQGDNAVRRYRLGTYSLGSDRIHSDRMGKKSSRSHAGRKHAVRTFSVQENTARQQATRNYPRKHQVTCQNQRLKQTVRPLLRQK